MPKPQNQRKLTKRNASGSIFCPSALLKQFEAITKLLGFEMVPYCEMNVKIVFALAHARGRTRGADARG